LTILICSGDDNAEPFGEPDKKQGCEKMIHGHGGSMQPRDMMLEKMWDELDDDQKRTLILRMIDSKILMKENLIKYLKFKVETFNMVKDMICECE
jgi:hypothetical protein